jgi:hypothetical protein
MVLMSKPAPGSENQMYLITVILIFHFLGSKMPVRPAVEQGLSGLVRRERKRGKSVHYEVDPKELHCAEGRLL